MNTVAASEIREIMEASHYRPAVSIIMPFEPKMKLKRELTASLERAVNKVEQVLQEHYPGEVAMFVMQKLKLIVNELNFNTHKNSIAIYVSPVFEKILYLDIAVEEKIIVDGSFAIRDLVYNKKQSRKYLVLSLSGKKMHIYLGDSGSLVRIVSNTPELVYAYINDAPQRVANFSDPSERKETVMDKFLQHIDNSLAIILNAYRLPLFVLAPEKILGHFKKLTKHREAVIEFVPGDYEQTPTEQLKEALNPYIEDWKKVKQRDLLNQIETAAGKKKLSAGIRNVWDEAMARKGRLLVVEKSYIPQSGTSDEIINKAMKSYNAHSYIKDEVDDIIEKVLENGGDVEFVDDGLLKNYQKIALVQYY
ncbi:MAG: hypothetical protein JWP81_3085 [Ferruginibacter sp.]|nr:hypothetical protein [Ferruginibacter sp.]